MEVLKRMRKIIFFTIGGLLVMILLLTGTLAGLYWSADMGIPAITQDSLMERQVEEKEGFRQCGENYFRHSESGLYEVFLKGGDYERGVAFGKLMPDLLYFQEKVFVNQIRELIPSENYLRFLRFFIVLFNRNLGKYVPVEYRREIYGIAQSCTHEYDFIGTPYERSLNYHGAHDIGHAMQDYMLVGCSSFGVWGKESADSSLLIGRNFDFYVGDGFARNKLVSFYAPEHGYKFASVGWAGMIGVLSGMNETGLTVTINAAKSTVPMSAATPISILTREILQYASTIEEAYAIAQKRSTFVAESILVGSAKDGEVAIIEKSPDKIGLYRSCTQQMICTNHYQSEAFRTDERNQENLKTSDSPYRFQRLEELLGEEQPLDVLKAAGILRDYRGLKGKDIGLGNEKALNQFIAHHSVIFKPEQKLMWVSTAPWQLGKYVAYDLNKIFAQADFSGELYESQLTIAADSFLLQPEYRSLLEYRAKIRQIKESIRTRSVLNDEFIADFIHTNPEHYYVYALAGEYYEAFGEPGLAVKYWRQALTKEIPKLGERQDIEERIDVFGV